MLEKLTKFVRAIRNIQSPVEYNLELYQKVLQEINTVQFNSLSDNRLQEISAELRSRSRAGVLVDSLLVEAFVLVREAARRVLGMYPFDTQVIAG